MLVATKTKFEVGVKAKHSASGLCLIQRLVGNDRAFVKFIAPTESGDTEEIVLLEDLESIEESVFAPQADAISVLVKNEMLGTPLKGKAPFLPGWQNSASKDIEQLSRLLKNRAEPANSRLV